MNSITHSMTRQQLWETLRTRSLVEGDLPPIDSDASPWFVRVMLGVAGWVGALFLLAFVGTALAFVFRNSEAALVIGVLSCVAAYFIFRTAKNNDFGTQFGLAVSLAGQAMVIFGLADSFKFRFNDASFYFLVFGFEVILALLLPNFIHRVLASGGAMVALALALAKLGIYGIAPGIAAACCALIWLDARNWAHNGALWRPIGYGLALALVQIDTFHLFGVHAWRFWSNGEPGWWLQYAPWIGAALVTVVLLYTACSLLAREGIAVASATGAAAFTAAILAGVLSLSAPGVATSILILLLGFASGNRVLMGLGLLALGGFLSHYYYQLHQTLLVKSMVLAASGIVLLAVRLALQKWLPADAGEESGNA